MLTVNNYSVNLKYKYNKSRKLNNNPSFGMAGKHLTPTLRTLADTLITASREITFSKLHLAVEKSSEDGVFKLAKEIHGLMTKDKLLRFKDAFADAQKIPKYSMERDFVDGALEKYLDELNKSDEGEKFISRLLGEAVEEASIKVVKNEQSFSMPPRDILSEFEQKPVEKVVKTAETPKTQEVAKLNGTTNEKVVDEAFESISDEATTQPKKIKQAQNDAHMPAAVQLNNFVEDFIKLEREDKIARIKDAFNVLLSKEIQTNENVQILGKTSIYMQNNPEMEFSEAFADAFGLAKDAKQRDFMQDKFKILVSRLQEETELNEFVKKLSGDTYDYEAINLVKYNPGNPGDDSALRRIKRDKLRDAKKQEIADFYADKVKALKEEALETSGSINSYASELDGIAKVEKELNEAGTHGLSKFERVQRAKERLLANIQENSQRYFEQKSGKVESLLTQKPKLKGYADLSELKKIMMVLENELEVVRENLFVFSYTDLFKMRKARMQLKKLEQEFPNQVEFKRKSEQINGLLHLDEIIDEEYKKLNLKPMLDSIQKRQVSDLEEEIKLLKTANNKFEKYYYTNQGWNKVKRDYSEAQQKITNKPKKTAFKNDNQYRCAIKRWEQSKNAILSNMRKAKQYEENIESILELQNKIAKIKQFAKPKPSQVAKAKVLEHQKQRFERYNTPAVRHALESRLAELGKKKEIFSSMDLADSNELEKVFKNAQNKKEVLRGFIETKSNKYFDMVKQIEDTEIEINNLKDLYAEHLKELSIWFEKVTDAKNDKKSFLDYVLPVIREMRREFAHAKKSYPNQTEWLNKKTQIQRMLDVDNFNSEEIAKLNLEPQLNHTQAQQVNKLELKINNLIDENERLYPSAFKTIKKGQTSHRVEIDYAKALDKLGSEPIREQFSSDAIFKQKLNAFKIRKRNIEQAWDRAKQFRANEREIDRTKRIISKLKSNVKVSEDELKKREILLMQRERLREHLDDFIKINPRKNTFYPITWGEYLQRELNKLENKKFFANITNRENYENELRKIAEQKIKLTEDIESSKSHLEEVENELSNLLKKIESEQAKVNIDD